MDHTKALARHLAAHGRKGDDMLVHVSRAELPGLAALNGGALPTNPHTGMPEAFGLGSILGALGSIAGIAAAPYTGGMSLALTGALGGGLGSMAGNLIDGKSFGDSLGSGLMSGVMGYGMGSAAGLLGSYADPVAQATANGVGTSALSAATPAATGVAADAAAASPYAFADGAGAAGGIGDATGGSLSLAPQAGMGGAAPYDISSLSQVPGGIAGFNVDPNAAVGSQLSPRSALQTMGDQFSGVGRNATNPDALWNTFGTNAMKTTVPIGLGLYGMSAYDNQQSGQQGPPQQQHNYPALPGPNQRKYTPRPADFDISRGREWNYWSPAFAEGGGISPPWADDVMPPQREVSRVAPNTRYLDDMFERRLQQMDWEQQTSDMNEMPGPQVRTFNPFDRPDPRTYQFAGGGGIFGPGGGLDDAIPAVVDGRHEARLSSGEFVVPAHAVSALGNGSSEEGVRQLDGMVNNVLQHKYGTTSRKVRPMDPRKMLPG